MGRLYFLKRAFQCGLFKISRRWVRTWGEHAPIKWAAVNQIPQSRHILTLRPRQIWETRKRRPGAGSRNRIPTFAIFRTKIPPIRPANNTVGDAVNGEGAEGRKINGREDPPDREYLGAKYTPSGRRRVYGRRAAAIAECPIVGASQKRLEAGRRRHECGVLLSANATRRCDTRIGRFLNASAKFCVWSLGNM